MPDLIPVPAAVVCIRSFPNLEHNWFPWTVERVYVTKLLSLLYVLTCNYATSNGQTELYPVVKEIIIEIRTISPLQAQVKLQQHC